MHEIDIVYKGVHLTFRLSFWCLHFILVFTSQFGVYMHSDPDTFFNYK